MGLNGASLGILWMRQVALNPAFTKWSSLWHLGKIRHRLVPGFGGTWRARLGWWHEL